MQFRSKRLNGGLDDRDILAIFYLLDLFELRIDARLHVSRQLIAGIFHGLLRKIDRRLRLVAHINELFLLLVFRRMRRSFSLHLFDIVLREVR